MASPKPTPFDPGYDGDADVDGDDDADGDGDDGNDEDDDGDDDGDDVLAWLRMQISDCLGARSEDFRGRQGPGVLEAAKTS